MTNTNWTAEMLERVLADAAALAPDAQLIVRDGWVQVTTPSRREHNRNGVFVSRLDASQVDERIAEIKQYYRELGCGFRWIVGPSSTPDDLSDRLTRAGIPVLGASMGMHMPVPLDVPAVPSTIEFRPLELADLDTYVDVSVRAWGPEARTREETERIVRSMIAEGHHLAWLVWENGEPVAVSVLCMLPGVGYFQGAAVVPERRRHGLYMAMIHHRLAYLRRLGIEHAVVWASESTSAGVCGRAGFVPLCRAVFHESPKTS